MHNFNQLDQDMHCPLCPQKKCSGSFKPSTLGATIRSYILRKLKGCVRARVIRDWNNLVNDTVHAKSINIFKVKLRLSG